MPHPEAAREVVDREPYDQAGLFEEHFVWRFANVLGRTIGSSQPPRTNHAFWSLPAEPRTWAHYLALVPLADLPRELCSCRILYGDLRNLDDDESAGSALAVQAQTRNALDALLEDASTQFAHCNDLEIHDWEFGGRR